MNKMDNYSSVNAFSIVHYSDEFPTFIFLFDSRLAD